MASQGFTDDLKYVLRALLRPTKMKIGAACAAAVAVLVVALALRGEARPMTHRTVARTSRPAIADAPRPARAASKSSVAGSPEESRGGYKTVAQSYATAAQKGDARGLDKLVAMTRDPKCEARSEAADALGSVRNTKAVAALTRLAASDFKDEPKLPGIFSCSSRRAAQKALEKHGRG